jgi:hypothetical protein
MPQKTYVGTANTFGHREQRCDSYGTGWIVAGVNELFTKEGKLDWLKEHEPVAMIGYSIWIYHITLDAANVIRAELGSP